MGATRIAVAGVGLIGRRHVATILNSSSAQLAALIDPGPEAPQKAEEAGVPWYPDLDAMPPGIADGVVLSTPNRHHVEGGMACITRGLPVLIEKPLATDTGEARRLVEAAEAAGVPLLVGHHRRHNPIIAAAEALIDGGEIGRVLSVHGMFWLRKPDDYFEEAVWRRTTGAGPILLNLVHDVDVLRHLVGEIVAVQAIASNAARGYPVEDTAAVLFEFASGAIGTFNISDAIPAPWSWELTSAENPAYAVTGQACYFIGGESGALELPRLRVWTHPGDGAWHDPMDARDVPHDGADPLVRQIEHFAAVVAGSVEPEVPGREGLRSLAVLEACRESAHLRERVTVDR